MPESLNDLDEEVLSAMLAEETKPLDAYRLEAQTTPDPELHVRLVAAIAARTFRAGLLSQGLNRPADVARFFRESVEARVTLFQSPLPHEDKTPAILRESIYAAIILGDWPAAAKFAQSQHYEPETYDDGGFVADRVIMGYIVALQEAVLQNTRQAQKLASENIKHNDDRKERFVKSFLLKTEALRAALKRDQTAFQQALDGIVRQHAREARKGRMRESPAGLLCVSGLGLAGIARQAGLEVESDSPYLPLSLLAS